MPAETANLFPKITDHALDDLRRRIGVKITDTLEPWCHEASRDGIRHYAHGIGDDNPLWCDPDYAARTRYGTIIAPPSFLFATSRIISGYVGGLPGRARHVGRARTGTGTCPCAATTPITTEAWLKDLIQHQTAFAGRPIQQIYHVDFYNQRGELVAGRTAGASAPTATSRASRAPSTPRSRRRAPKRYTDEELAEVYQLYANEEVRGRRAALLAGRGRGRAAPAPWPRDR